MDTVSMTAREYAYLAACCGARTLWWLPDPFGGLTGERLEGALAQAAASLAKKRIVDLGFDGELRIPPDVLRLAGCCALPDRSLALSLSSPASRTVCFEKSGLWTVCSWDGGNRVQLRESQEDGAIESLAGALSLPEEAPPGNLLLAEEELCRLAAAGRERCSALLREKGFGGEAADRAAAALSAPISAAALTLIDHAGGRQRGMAITAGEADAVASAIEAGGCSVSLLTAGRLRGICAGWLRDTAPKKEGIA